MAVIVVGTLTNCTYNIGNLSIWGQKEYSCTWNKNLSGSSEGMIGDGNFLNDAQSLQIEKNTFVVIIWKQKLIKYHLKSALSAITPYCLKYMFRWKLYGNYTLCKRWLKLKDGVTLQAIFYFKLGNSGWFTVGTYDSCN